MDIFKYFLPRTLFWRSLMIMVTPILLVQIIATVIYYDRHVEVITRRLALGVGGDVKLVLSELEYLSSEEKQRDFLSRVQGNLGLTVDVLGQTTLNQVYVPFDLSLIRQMIARSLGDALSLPFVLDMESDPDWIFLYVEANGKVIRFQFNHKRVSTSTTYLFVLWSWGLSLILVTISIIFLRNQVRPIRNLASAAEAFGRGHELAASFKPSGAREVRQAGVAFMDMKNRIARHIRQRTDMLAGVSHDLRTPLTRMKLQLAMATDGDLIKSLNEDIHEMETMINGYLDFTRGEGGEAAVEVDLCHLVRDTVQSFGRSGFPVTYLDCSNEMRLTLRPNTVKRAINNILENARRYAQSAKVRLILENKVYILSIEDDGPGIPEEQRTEVFRPFMRLEESRNLETGGAGLGLTIVRDVMQAMGGEVRLEQSDLGGLQVNLIFPR